MKTICEVHNSLNNKESYIRAKQIDEPFVKAALMEMCWDVLPGTYIEDFEHTDLKVIHTPKSNKVFSIDVKRSDKKNAYTPNFLITTVSKTGKKFPFSPTAFFAFIDDNDKSITIIRQSKIEEIINDGSIDTAKLPSNYGIGKFVLINKDVVKQKADMIVNPSTEVKKLLYWL